MLIRHPDSARGNDLYETPEVATLSLLAVEPLPPTILAPACGRGAISKVLRSAGHTVIENDIVDYRQGQDSVQDFLNFELAQAGEIDAVVTNPPYRLAQQFVRHALTLCPRVLMLLRLTFLESERRRDVLDGAGLIRVHVFRNRLPMMHRDGWAGNRVSNPTAFAWYVWESLKLIVSRGIELRHDQSSPGAAMIRRTLPQRRAAETFDLRFWNQLFTVTVGFYADGTPGEVFIDSRKTGGDVEAVARDAAVTLSLYLQHGVPIESIRHAATRNGASGAPASIIGAVVDAVADHDKVPR